LYITKECKDSTIVYNAERAATMPENVREALTRVFQDIQEAGIEIAKAKNAYKEQ
jgi:hypothetical protein